MHKNIQKKRNMHSPPLVDFIEETDSTNNLMQRWCEEREESEMPEFTTILTDFQTGGRGQAGNKWESRRGSNLTFSILLRPKRINIKNSFLISQIASLAVKLTLEKYSSDITIKWPNDIYWQDKKIGGILIENDLMGPAIQKSIVGFGININQDVFLSDAPNPISLRQIVGKCVSKLEFLKHFFSLFRTTYYAIEKDVYPIEKLVLEYKESLYRGEGFHHYSDAEGSFEARFIDVLPTGELVLEDREGRRRQYWFKEVSYVM